MVRTLLIRGMLVGIFAGLLVFAVGRLVGEAPIDRAIGFESALDEARAKTDAAQGLHKVDEPELVSRGVQSGLGLFTAVVVYSTAFGGLFALVFAVVDRRIPSLGPRAVSALLAALGFIAVYVVPNIKYPANPPSVGEADTIGQRTALYFVMLALSVAAMAVAAMLRGRLTGRFGAWNATIIAGGLYLVAVLVVGGVLPAIDEVPESFPAILLWQFRIASLGMQAVMWATLGLGFGYFTDRALRSGAGVTNRLRRFEAA